MVRVDISHHSQQQDEIEIVSTSSEESNSCYDSEGDYRWIVTEAEYQQYAKVENPGDIGYNTVRVSGSTPSWKLNSDSSVDFRDCDMDNKANCDYKANSDTDSNGGSIIKVSKVREEEEELFDMDSNGLAYDMDMITEYGSISTSTLSTEYGSSFSDQSECCGCQCIIL